MRPSSLFLLDLFIIQGFVRFIHIGLGKIDKHIFEYYQKERMSGGIFEDQCVRKGVIMGRKRIEVNIFIIFFSKSMIQYTSQMQKTEVSQLKERQGLFDVAELQQKTVAALKTAFVYWIRSLLMEERFLALKIYSGPIPQLLRKIFLKLQKLHTERGSEIPNSKAEYHTKGEIFGDLKKPVRKLEKGFYDSLVFISDGQDYLDHICFDFGFLECPDRLFDLITAPSADNPNAKLLLQAINLQEPLQLVAQKILSCTTLEQVALVTLKFLQQEILLRFRESLLCPEFISKSLDEEKRRKREFSFHLKHLSQDQKKRMVFLGFKDIQELKKWLVFNEIKIDFSELEKEASELLKLQKNQFSNRIFKCKLKKSLSLIVNYHEQIYIFWKNEIGKIKKRKFSTKFSGEKIEKDSHFSKVEEKDSKQSHLKRMKMRRKKSVSVESNETNVTWQEKRRAKEKMLSYIDVPLESSPPRAIEVQKPKQPREAHHYKQMMEKPPMEPSQKKKNKKRRGKDKIKDDKQHNRAKIEEKPIEHVEHHHYIQKPVVHFPENEDNSKKKISMTIENLREFGLAAIEEELQNFADKISQQANMYHDRRIIAFERIQFLLSYYYVNIELFGSCASGIAIRNSDIDIAVKNQILGYFDYVPEHLRLIGALENLQQIFASQDYISDISFIGTASIPIIKMKIDTSKTCLSPQYGEMYERLNRPHSSGVIEADITIQTLNPQSQCNHLGIISTLTINQWLKQIPTLHSIVITLKLLLQSRRLHKTYEGGLNTFSMIILVVSYIYHAKLQKESNPALVLEQMLKFYVYQFDERQTGIDILNYGTSSIFYLKKQRAKEEEYLDTRQKADLQILDPKCKGRNMTGKSYLFPKIKQFFKEMYQQCFQMKFKQIEALISIEEKTQIHPKYIGKDKVLKENSFEKLLQSA